MNNPDIEEKIQITRTTKGFGYKPTHWPLSLAHPSNWVSVAWCHISSIPLLGTVVDKLLLLAKFYVIWRLTGAIPSK
jgi:hypothetical protein